MSKHDSTTFSALDGVLEGDEMFWEQVRSLYNGMPQAYRDWAMQTRTLAEHLDFLLEMMRSYAMSYGRAMKLQQAKWLQNRVFDLATLNQDILRTLPPEDQKRRGGVHEVRKNNRRIEMIEFYADAEFRPTRPHVAFEAKRKSPRRI